MHRRSPIALAVAAAPGYSTSFGGDVSGLPVIDGLGDDRLRVLVNGITITSACPNHMNPALSYIDPASVDSVSVFAGITPVPAPVIEAPPMPLPAGSPRLG
jgi:iron complex outermembrane recepter protein